MTLATRAVGVLLVILGLFVNRWTLERYVVYDGTIGTGAVSWGIAAAQIAMVLAGVWLFATAPRHRAPAPGNLLLAGFSLSSSLVFVEVAFRWLDPGWAPDPVAWVGQHENRESSNFEVDPHLGWRMIPNRVFRWSHEGAAPIAYRGNAQGFRAERDFDDGPGPIIALAGDSFTWGTGVAVEDTFGARLAERFPAAKVRNHGMPGFGIDQMWMTVRHYALPARPALVVVSFIDDDFQRSLTAYRHGEGFNKPKFRLSWQGELVRETPADAPLLPVRLLRVHSRLWNLLESRVQSLRPWGDRWELNLAILERIAADCAEADVPVVFLRIPQRGQRDFPLLGRELARRGLVFGDVGERVGDAPDELYLPKDDHMNARGHALLAEAVLELLREARIEPGGAAPAADRDATATGDRSG